VRLSEVANRIRKRVTRGFGLGFFVLQNLKRPRTLELHDKAPLFRKGGDSRLNLGIAPKAMLATVCCPVSNINEQSRRAVSGFPFTNGHGVDLPRPNPVLTWKRKPITAVTLCRIGPLACPGFTEGHAPTVREFAGANAVDVGFGAAVFGALRVTFELTAECIGFE
jgi:hypothetical protein